VYELSVTWHQRTGQTWHFSLCAWEKDRLGQAMVYVRVVIMMLAAVLLASCGSSKFQRYNGPAVTMIEVHKADRKMYLLHNRTVLESYDIALGFAPVGHKQVEGDGKTPEGAYRINRRNPNSQYHLSIGLSYPDVNDVAYARGLGQNAGGEIFIHGGPRSAIVQRDWTAGCIAVTDREMEQIYAMVKDGTVIQIFP
jgi:murein L,D-transpeptidase YafK